MKDNSSSAIEIKYYSTCCSSPDCSEAEEKERSKCDGLKVGDVVYFSASIRVLQCPKDPKDWHQTIVIYPVGLNEGLVIDLEMVCDCQCNYPGHFMYHDFSEECNNRGTSKCGVCECGDSFFGRKCECSHIDAHSDVSGLGCRPDNTTDIDCSGRGNCVCGICECDPRPFAEEVISGKFCECDNFSCDRFNGKLCSGPEQGTCVCGECVCNDGFTGSDCSCRASNDTCMPKNGGEICSGHGDCECGSCVCHIDKDSRYSGKYCEKCPTCSGRCAEFRDCVECQMYKTGKLG
jgi:protocadherin alpha